MKPTLKFMVGIPSSGKSTYAEKMKEQDYVIHASDQLRIELYGNVNTFDKNGELFDELHKRVKRDLMAGKNVVYDATNLTAKLRIHFLQNVINKIDCEKIAVVIAKPYNQCVQDDKLREKKVGHNVIYRMYTGFNFPSVSEGFDEVDIYYATEQEFSVIDAIGQANMIYQNNSNHTKTIGEHCRMVSLALTPHGEELSKAGLLHDISKHKVANFMNSKGEITEQCHYYGHENVSVYDSMFLLRHTDKELRNNILNLIQNHMKPHLLKELKQIERFKNQYGEEFWDKLLILHEADKGAR